MPSHSKWLWCPTSWWDWMDIFQVCVNRYKLYSECQCCYWDAETKQIMALYYPCSVCLFFFPRSLLLFIVSFWAHVSCLCYLGKNNGKTRAESVMIGWKVRLLNLYPMCAKSWAMSGLLTDSSSAHLSQLQVIQVDAVLIVWVICLLSSLSVAFFLASFQIINQI